MRIILTGQPSDSSGGTFKRWILNECKAGHCKLILAAHAGGGPLSHLPAHPRPFVWPPIDVSLVFPAQVSTELFRVSCPIICFD